MTPPHTIQEVEDLILKEFDEKFPALWKVHSTPEIGRYEHIEAEEDVKDFLRSQIHKIAAQTLSAVVPYECSESGDPKDVVGLGQAKAHNSCRQEVLRRGKEFLNEL